MNLEDILSAKYSFKGMDALVEDPTDKLPEEFVPETTKETTSLLSKALNWKENPVKEDEYTLKENVFIPSHEDNDNDSLANLHEFEQEPAPADLRNCSDSETLEDCKLDEHLKGCNTSDSKDSLDLEALEGELIRRLTEAEGRLGLSAASSAAVASEGEHNSDTDL